MGIAVFAALVIACGVCPAVAAGSATVVANQPTAADPLPQPEPSADPSPQPEPTADPSPQPEPTADPSPQPEPTADPEPDADPQPDHESQRRPAATADDEPAPQPAAAGALTEGPQASAHGPLPANVATADLPTGAVGETVTDPAAGTAARRTSIVARVVSGQAHRPAQQPVALGAEPGLLVPDLLTTLRGQTEQRETHARRRATGTRARNPRATRRPPPDPGAPLGPPQDIVVGSAAAPGGIAPPALWCVICTVHAVRDGHELRRLRAPLLAPDLPGLHSLRDRPG